MKVRITNIFFFSMGFLKKNALLFLFSLHCLCTEGQYWQQRVNYTIDVRLDDKERTLDAYEKIAYLNNSPDTLGYIWFHLWPNAYKNDLTAFSEQLLENGNTNFYFSTKEERGYINRLDFKVDGITAILEDHPKYIDIIKLILPHPLAPHQEVNITTPFHVKLPFNFSRGGYDGQSFQLTQWYPKPAVYDKNGWHPIAYLDQGEFFSEFGHYSISITVPQNYVVAATGILQDTLEKNWLKARSYEKWGKEYINKYGTTQRRKAGQPTGHSMNKWLDSLPVVFPPSDSQTKTLHFTQDSVHDFAWFADKRFIVKQDSCRLPSGKTILVASFYTIKEHEYWKNSLAFAKDALRFYSGQIGEYPYASACVVQGPQSFGGGMEYPTIAIIAPLQSERDLDETIAHELGHNWFYGALASNERDYPWMDEGLNTFYEYRYIEFKYGRQTQEKELLFEAKAKLQTDQPIATSSAQFSMTNYDLVAYHKTAEWMAYLQQVLGNSLFQKMMQAYFSQLKFTHPYPEDFKSVVKQFAGSQTDSLFALLKSKGILPNHHPHGLSLITPFKIATIYNYLENPKRHALVIAPALGANHYDRLMAGFFISNYKLPPDKFRFFAAPLYAKGSHRFVGIGRMDYLIPWEGSQSRTEFFVNAASFSMNQFKGNDGHKLYFGFGKLVPGVRITLKKPDPRSTVNQYIQWKTFLIKEQFLKFTQDTFINGGDSSFLSTPARVTEKRILNQLQVVYENYRALYPYKFILQFEQARDFVKTTLVANYYFNYAGSGGLQARFFGGKFFYLKGRTLERQFANDRYFLNMTGPKGFEDYTYSEHFLGRNSFQGFTAQQIITKDGGFKVRTDLLANKIGKTDNWLCAINLNSTIPEKLNPFSILPFKMPFHVFFDAGTYGEAWQNNFEGDRFLYDLGIHIPLFAETVHLYIPLFYNKVYGDYFKSTLSPNRFLKTISFSINFFNRALKQINREIEF